MELEAAIEQRLREFRESLQRTGTVTGTAGTKVVVTVDGTSMTLPRLSTYTPTATDTVNILTLIPGAWLVLGKSA